LYILKSLDFYRGFFYAIILAGVIIKKHKIMGLKIDLTLQVNRWRTDLGKVERVLNDAYSSVQRVEDGETAKQFVSDFDNLAKEAKSLADDINSFYSNARSLKSEMDDQDEKAERKREEEEAKKKKDEEAAEKE
jgi:predicted  nucleic acid-binding Zn-ribbon protein